MLNLKSIIALSDPPLSIPIHYQYEVTKWGGGGVSRSRAEIYEWEEKEGGGVNLELGRTDTQVSRCVLFWQG